VILSCMILRRTAGCGMGKGPLALTGQPGLPGPSPAILLMTVIMGFGPHGGGRPERARMRGMGRGGGGPNICCGCGIMAIRRRTSVVSIVS